MSPTATRRLTRDTYRRPSRYALPMPPDDQGDLAALAGSFARDLRDRDLSPNTEYVYLTGITLFGRFLAEQNMPRSVAQITGEHAREFFRELRYEKSANTVANRFRALTAFFKWCVKEGEIVKSPLERMERPKVPEAPPELITDDEVRRLLAVCQGTDFLSRRDTAIIRLFFDVGCRRSELSYLRLEDVKLSANPPVVTFVGKGRRVRTVAIASKAAAAMDRYMRIRSRHKHAKLEALWLGRLGAVGDGAIDLMLRRRAAEAGISVHAHMFRHLYAHTALSHPDTKEGDVMAQAGWRSRQMLARYGASAQAERARQAHVRLGLGDRL